MLKKIYSIHKKLFSKIHTGHKRLYESQKRVTKLYAFTKEHTVNPSFPDSKINVVADFSLQYGQYTNLTETPVGWEHKEDIEQEGIIIEVSTGEQQKLVFLIKNKQDFIDKFTQETTIDYDSIHSIWSADDCDLCESNINNYSLIGDHIYMVKPFIARIGESERITGVCHECRRDVLRAAIEDPAFNIASKEEIMAETI